ncbi:hypothetical protein SDC9_05980 [bioreactor metagenome]|uniref:Type II secretion system protein GspC N-terminal domain-containing protein n=1 Tax=bioreactor metagenome TaxID=1076179 RepID=A0A644T0V0_9ZZZZ|nr:hypothetical protein [Negativicutes bacterium]
MDLLKTYSNLSHQHRIYLLLIISIVMISLISFMTTNTSDSISPVASSPATTPLVSKKQLKAGPSMPTGYQSKTAVTRDPFSLPPEYKTANMDNGLSQHSDTSNSLSVFNSKPQTQQPPDTLKLTGLAGAGDNRMAVIRSGNKSKTYSIHEKVGLYIILHVTENAVILDGPGGKRILHLEGATKNGAGGKNEA